MSTRSGAAGAPWLVIVRILPCEQRPSLFGSIVKWSLHTCGFVFTSWDSCVSVKKGTAPYPKRYIVFSPKPKKSDCRTFLVRTQPKSHTGLRRKVPVSRPAPAERYMNDFYFKVVHNAQGEQRTSCHSGDVNVCFRDKLSDDCVASVAMATSTEGRWSFKSAFQALMFSLLW